MGLHPRQSGDSLMTVSKSWRMCIADEVESEGGIGVAEA